MFNGLVMNGGLSVHQTKCFFSLNKDYIDALKVHF